MHRTADAVLRSALLSLLVFSAVVWPSVFAQALTYPVTIAIDGVFTDWTSVLADSDNFRSDPTGSADADLVAAGADLSQAATTWDATYLYGYMRLNSQVKGKVDLRIYLDLDGDGLMGAGDRVAVFAFNPAGKNPTVGLAAYTPTSPTGDPMLGNGTSLPGTVGAAAFTTNMSGSNINDGRAEVRIPWAGLGRAPGSAVNMQFAMVDGATGRIDNVNVISTRYHGVTLVPNNTQAAAIGSVAEYAHTITNTGNGTDTYTLARTSLLGWPVAVVDPDTGEAIASITLAAGVAKQLIVRVTVPASALAGAKDVTTVRATSTLKATVTAAVTDTTFAGPVGIDPDRQGSMAPGGTIQFWHTVSNDMPTQQIVDLTALSSNGWTTGLFSAGGSPITSITLESKASATVLVRLTVPDGAAPGTVDTMVVRAALQDEPTVFDQVTNTTTVRATLTVEPDRSRITGANTTVSYRHTITNSSAADRTFALAAVSSLGWTVRIYDATGVNLISSIAIPAYGGSADVWVRVTVPGTVPVGAEDVTILTASHAGSGLSASARDTTTVTQLVTYDSDTLINQSSSFGQERRVWAQGSALTPYDAVRFVWIDASGATVHTSSNVDVEPDGTAVASYMLGRNAPVGTWTCIVVNAAGGGEITRSTFQVYLVPWLTMTITPDSIAFDGVSPGQATEVLVSVIADSNAPYTITRQVSGMVDEMGFSVTGSASGNKPTGPNTWQDIYRVVVPWTTDPSTALEATVRYSVVY